MEVAEIGREYRGIVLGNKKALRRGRIVVCGVWWWCVGLFFAVDCTSMWIFMTMAIGVVGGERYSTKV